MPPGSICAIRNGLSFVSRNDAHVSIDVFVRMFSLQSFSQVSNPRLAGRPLVFRILLFFVLFVRAG